MPNRGYFPPRLSPLSIPPSAFVGRYDDYDYSVDHVLLSNGTTLTAQDFYAPVFLPNGVTVTKLTLFGHRTAAGSELRLKLCRNNREGAFGGLGEVLADWTSGYSSGYDDTITNPTIDNNDYDYSLVITIDPDAAAGDCQFSGAKIEFAG